MERRVNKKIENYITELKGNLKAFIESKEGIPEGVYNELVNYIDTYERLELKKEDIEKRRRVKNKISDSERCLALKADMSQCTRRRLDDCEYCGTHKKNRPNGVIQDKKEVKKVVLKSVIENGIVYYVNSEGEKYDGRTMTKLSGTGGEASG